MRLLCPVWRQLPHVYKQITRQSIPESTLSLSLFDFKNTGTQLLDFNSFTCLKLTNSASLEFSQESNDTQNLTLSKIRVHPSYLSVIMGLLRHLKIKSDNGELHDIPIEIQPKKHKLYTNEMKPQMARYFTTGLLALSTELLTHLILFGTH